MRKQANGGKAAPAVRAACGCSQEDIDIEVLLGLLDKLVAQRQVRAHKVAATLFSEQTGVGDEPDRYENGRYASAHPPRRYPG